MGLFDSVNYKAKCPNCGANIDTWQTKEGACILELLEPWEVKYFHGSCECGAWIEARVNAEVEHIVKKCDIKLSVKRLTGIQK